MLPTARMIEDGPHESCSIVDTFASFIVRESLGQGTPALDVPGADGCMQPVTSVSAIWREQSNTEQISPLPTPRL
jgi:hypothetical protein